MADERWDRAYREGHHATRWDTPWSSPELAGFLAGAPTLPRTAIDLGCGTGGDAVFLAERGIETTGVDLSPTALDMGRTRQEAAGVRVTWIEADVLHLPVDDSSFDLAIDRGCLHHIPHDDHPTYVREVARILRPGGTLVIREMNEEGRHKHAVTEASIRAAARDSALAVRTVVPFDMVGPAGHRRAIIAVLDCD